MKKIVIRARAKRDLRNHALHISKDRPSSADAFIHAVYSTFEQLVHMPEMGMVFETIDGKLTNMRRIRVRGFDYYLVFYVSANETLRIVRIIHAARDIEKLFRNEDQVSERIAPQATVSIFTAKILPRLYSVPKIVPPYLSRY